MSRLDEKQYKLTVTGLTEDEAKNAYAWAIGLQNSYELLPTGPTYSGHNRKSTIRVPVPVQLEITPDEMKRNRVTVVMHHHSLFDPHPEVPGYREVWVNRSATSGRTEYIFESED